jgi:hypothetical protein
LHQRVLQPEKGRALMAGRKKPDEAALAETLSAIGAREPVLAPDFAEISEAPRESFIPRLPQPCPVTPLGVNGSRIVFLDGLNQLQTAATDCKKNEMKLWFGEEYLLEHWPEYKTEPRKKGEEVRFTRIAKFNQDESSSAFIHDCRLKGVFNAQGRLFGRGAHRPKADPRQIVLHMGRQVMIAPAFDKHGRELKDPELRPAGPVRDAAGNETFFPALGALPPPAGSPSTLAEAESLLALFGKWRFVDEAAPRLLLGMTAQMFVCGALPWRSHMWLAGPTAAGKSLLQTVIRTIHDDWCLHTEDASEAAIRQILGDDTLPVLIDEAEAHDNPERQKAILNLMKKASSGAKIHRGGADHKGQEFTAQSCFLLSSVLHTAMKGEDRNRICILNMRAIPVETPPLELELAAWRQMGRRMHRRMIEQWPRFERTLSAYKVEIAKHRFEGRWQDTYGTLLACADMLLHDHAPQDVVLAESEAGGLERVNRAVLSCLPLMAAGRADARSDVDRVLIHLASKMLPGAHGKPPEPVGHWITRAMTWRQEGGQFPTDPVSNVTDQEARDRLRAHGLRAIALSPDPRGGWKYEDARPEDPNAFLAVAYATNQPLAELFRGSEWAEGGWLQSLRKVPDAIGTGLKVHFAGKSDNAVAVPIRAVLGDDWMAGAG